LKGENTGKATCQHSLNECYDCRRFDILNGFEIRETKCINCHKTLVLDVKKFWRFCLNNVCFYRKHNVKPLFLFFASQNKKIIERIRIGQKRARFTIFLLENDSLKLDNIQTFIFIINIAVFIFSSWLLASFCLFTYYIFWNILLKSWD